MKKGKRQKGEGDNYGGRAKNYERREELRMKGERKKNRKRQRGKDEKP